MKLLLKIVSWILGVVFILVLVLGGFCLYVNAKYKINVFNVLKQLNELGNAVTISEMAPNAFSGDDMQSACNEINASIPGLIQKDGENYTIGTPIVPAMLQDIKLTDKETGALLNNFIQSNGEMKIQVNGSDVNLKDYDFKLVQVQFSEVKDGSANVNFVVSLNLTKLKEKMTSFPISLFKNKVPETLYLSSNVKIAKGTDAFAYTVESVALTINKLDSKTVSDLFVLLDKFTKIGTANDFNKMVGSMFANALIGTSEQSGFAYGLKKTSTFEGAVDYLFAVDTDVNYFEIKK